MKFSIGYLCALTLFIILFVPKAKSQEIKIGQKCPDVILRNVINYNTDEIRLSDFKGKLMILDFWSTSCSACIQGFSKIDSLQNKFNDQIQFIAVNSQSHDSTINFFNRKRHIKKPSIPFVTGDIILSKLFPHLYVPHHVWIDNTGIVQYITDGYNATEEHINKFIAGENINLAEKKFEPVNSFESPLIALTKGKGLENLKSYSFLGHCISGMTFSNAATSSSDNIKPNRITQNCASIGQLYEIAFNEGGKHNFSPANTIIYNVKKLSKYKIPANNNEMDEWKTNYSFNYELFIPVSEADLLYKKMQQDLYRYFDVKAKIEKKSIDCLALMRTDIKDRLKTKGEPPSTNFWMITSDSIKFMNNQSFESFVKAISVSYITTINKKPFIDATKYKGNIDIKLSNELLDTFNMNQVNSELKRYGLLVIKTKKIMDVLVLTDN